MELTLEQMVILGLLATALTQVIKWIMAALGKEMKVWLVSLIVVMVSFAFAVIWGKPTWPAPGEDIMAFIAQLLAAVTSVVGWATVIYNFLFKAVLEKLELTPKQMLKLLNTRK